MIMNIIDNRHVVVVVVYWLNISNTAYEENVRLLYCTGHHKFLYKRFRQSRMLRQVTKAWSRDHMTPILRQLGSHGSPVEFKVASFVHQVLSSQAPTYIWPTISTSPQEVLLVSSGPPHVESVQLVTDLLQQLDRVSGTITGQSVRSRNQLHRFQETTEDTHVSIWHRDLTSDYLCLINALAYLLLTYLLFTTKRASVNVFHIGYIFFYFYKALWSPTQLRWDGDVVM